MLASILAAVRLQLPLGLKLQYRDKVRRIDGCLIFRALILAEGTLISLLCKDAESGLDRGIDADWRMRLADSASRHWLKGSSKPSRVAGTARLLMSVTLPEKVFRCAQAERSRYLPTGAGEAASKVALCAYCEERKWCRLVVPQPEKWCDFEHVVLNFRHWALHEAVHCHGNSREPGNGWLCVRHIFWAKDI